MRYRLLRQDCRPDNWSIQCIEGITVHALNRGVPVEAPEQVARVTLSALGQHACDFLETPCPIVSDRMRRGFDRAGVDNVQWFPAQLEVAIFNTVHPGYWAMNVVGKLACVDLPASDLEQDDDGRILDLRSFQIDAARTYGMDVFRVAEDLRAIAVSERLQRLLRAASLEGVVFQDASSYDCGFPVSGVDDLRAAGLPT